MRSINYVTSIGNHIMNVIVLVLESNIGSGISRVLIEIVYSLDESFIILEF